MIVVDSDLDIELCPFLTPTIHLSTSLHTSPHLIRASHCCSSDISVSHQAVPCCSSGLHISGLSLPGESGDHRKLGLPRIAQACQQLGAEPLSPPPSLPWGASLQGAGGGATCCVCVWARTAQASVFSSAMWVPTDMPPQPVLSMTGVRWTEHHSVLSTSWVWAPEAMGAQISGCFRRSTFRPPWSRRRR